MLCARSAGTAAKSGTSADSKMWSRFQNQVLCSWNPWGFPKFAGSTVTFFTAGQLLLQVARYLSRVESDTQRSPEIKGLLSWFICFYSCSILSRSHLSAACYIICSMFASGISSALFGGVEVTWPKPDSFLWSLDTGGTLYQIFPWLQFVTDWLTCVTYKLSLKYLSLKKYFTWFQKQTWKTTSNPVHTYQMNFDPSSSNILYAADIFLKKK